MSLRATSSICHIGRRSVPRLTNYGDRLRSSARWSSTLDRKWSTPLAKTLAEAITTTGPISIANYMRQCLTSDLGGYYSKQADPESDQFGKKGDFVTSPEISQIFGELVGVWFVAEWMAQGSRRNGVQLIELGPGRGTLMMDMLRTLKNFRSMASSIETIYLVESSPGLREAQRALLCGSAPLEEHKIGHSSKCQHLPNAQVIWTEDVSFLPKDSSKTPFIVAHEFFDALPFHAFTSVPQQLPAAKNNGDDAPLATSTSPTPPRPAQQKLANEWRELLVSPTAPPSPFNTKPTSDTADPAPEFELTVSPRATPHSRLLPTFSPRYKSLLSSSNSTIEVSPAARTTTSILAQLIGGAPLKPSKHTSASTPASTSSGAALLIDYGPASTIPINTLRGIRAHKHVSPFSSAGLVDLSADVDFGALVEAALEGSEGVEVHGPAEQGAWLEAMGGKERKDVLVTRARAGAVSGLNAGTPTKDDGAEVAQRVDSGWSRLVDRGPNGMGKLYKVLAVVPDNGGSRRPVGLGGDVAA